MFFDGQELRFLLVFAYLAVGAALVSCTNVDPDTTLTPPEPVDLSGAAVFGDPDAADGKLHDDARETA